MPPLIPQATRPASVLSEIFRTHTAPDLTGRTREVFSGINEESATALYRVVRQKKPKVCVEIGFANGVSTLAVLAALEENGRGRLISVDPNQRDEWHSVGLSVVRKSGMEGRHELVELPSHLALPRMLEQGLRIDLAYVDGWHTFDAVLLDFFYLDKLLKVEGVIGFDNCNFRSVNKVMRFLRTHRHYGEMEVGLKKNYRGRNALVTAARFIIRRANRNRYFHKLDNWEPPHNFYRLF
jgi:predicted O-methyltransferase YrrM